MKYSFFEIENFKGIERVRIDFEDAPQLNVYTLVGLNESGKTTILEAINAFTYKTETLKPLELPRYSISDVHELIPISKRENFNESVKIVVGLTLEEEDEKLIAKQLKKELGFRLAEDIGKVTIYQVYKFSDSKYNQEESPVEWELRLYGKKKRAKINRELRGEDWKQAMQFIKPLIPSILYFPNFLFDFPDRIYLGDYGVDDAQHKFYRTVIQDILDSLGTGTNIETHILDRAKSGDANDKKHLSALLLKMSRKVSKTVFDAWSKIFDRKIQDMEITIDCDSDESGRYYLAFEIKDADGIYAINERSLGFRWFFVFLLLTQFRGFRKDAPKNVLFLFDEPASNLHPTAQTQLLNSLDKLTENGKVIYTTHSQYLINPDWLEGAYVVKNEGLDYEDEEAYTARKTKIVLERYRTFAVKYPDQTTYFQPILDVLDYSPSKLENVPNVIMCEGKNDFYILSYFCKVICRDKSKLEFLPGTGASSLDNVIRLYIGWGLNFLVFLDSDSEGGRQKERYLREFGAIVEDRILTLEDINKDWKKCELEDLIPESERLDLQKSTYPESKEYEKIHFNRGIQENFVRKVKWDFSKEATGNFEQVIDFLGERLHNVGSR